MKMNEKLSDRAFTSVFVYGTLKVGRELAYQLDEARISSIPAILDGYILYDLGWFPGIKEGHGEVTGELHRYAHPEETLSILDSIEGYSPSRTDNLYTRIRAQVRTEAGNIEAHVYVFNGKLPDKVQIIENGIW